MPHLRISNRLVVAVACLLATGASAALAVPPKNLLTLSKLSSFTPEQEAQLIAFIDLHASALGGDDESSRPAARQKLMIDLTGRTGERATPIFRMTYSDLLLPKLKDMISDGSTTAGIAATQVTSALGTDAAVTVLTRHLSPAQEPREAIRIWAAAGMRPLIAEQNVSSSRLTRAVSDLGRAAQSEASWPVLRQQLASIGSATRNKRTKDSGQLEIMNAGAKNQSTALVAVIARLQGGDLAMLEVIEPHMREIQAQFLDQADPAVLRVLARTTAPALATLFEAVLAQWDAILADQRSAELAGRSLNRAEVMIGQFDDTLTGDTRTLSPSHHTSLTNGDNTELQASQRRWGNIGSLPRYQE